MQLLGDEHRFIMFAPHALVLIRKVIFSSFLCVSGNDVECWLHALGSHATYLPDCLGKIK